MWTWLLALALGDTAAPAEEADPTEAPTQEVVVVETLDETSGIVQRTVHRPPPPKDYREELLGVAALMALLLLSRVNRRKRQQRQRPTRRTPLSTDELGRSVFEAARSADLELFRGLFLTGGEAGHLLGQDEAASWLNRRSNRVLVDALAGLAVFCDAGATLIHAHMDGETLVLKVRRADREHEVPVATVRQIGTAHRLFELATR